MQAVRPRLNSIDLVRGIAMVLMALDHVRDFFWYDLSYDPTDLEKTTPGLFLTRWLTHFCAPAFVLLAGVGAALSIQRGRTRGKQAAFLVTRGLWLIFLELVVIRSGGWFFNFDLTYLPGWVIWALGWSMIGLATMLWLPRRWVLLFGLLIISCHNLLNGIDPESLGPLEGLWIVLLGKPTSLMIAGKVEFAMGYPLLPWFGVMLLGYGLAEVYAWSADRRRSVLFRLSLICLGLFALLRLSNLYGEVKPWQSQGDWFLSLLSILNCTKQPPSLCFLLMTLGPALLLLAMTEELDGPAARVFITFGRVPMFFYLLHLPLIHALACAASYWQLGHLQPWLFANPHEPWEGVPSFWDRNAFGFGLVGVYAVWLAVVALLYPLCRWYAEFKARNRWWILSYI